MSISTLVSSSSLRTIFSLLMLPEFRADLLVLSPIAIENLTGPSGAGVSVLGALLLVGGVLDVFVLLELLLPPVLEHPATNAAVTNRIDIGLKIFLILLPFSTSL